MFLITYLKKDHMNECVDPMSSCEKVEGGGGDNIFIAL